MMKTPHLGVARRIRFLARMCTPALAIKCRRPVTNARLAATAAQDRYITLASSGIDLGARAGKVDGLTPRESACRVGSLNSKARPGVSSAAWFGMIAAIDRRGLAYD
jgi:hypothetical protein